MKLFHGTLFLVLIALSLEIKAQGRTAKEFNEEMVYVSGGYDLNQEGLFFEIGKYPGLLNLGGGYATGLIDNNEAEEFQMYLKYVFTLDQLTDPNALYYNPIGIELIGGGALATIDTGNTISEDVGGFVYGAGVSLRFEPLLLGVSYSKSTASEWEYLTLKLGFILRYE